ncbi:MAG: hypothetical protein EBR01_12080 [Proteobacteria bacterium]|nr:hypothetical protein [Pseudomonadota bacterium]
MKPNLFESICLIKNVKNLNFFLVSVISLFVAASSFLVAADDLQDTGLGEFNANSAEAVKLDKFKQSAKRILMNKLSMPDGGNAKIHVLRPINYTDLKSIEPLRNTIQSSIEKYDPSISVSKTDQTLPSLTLESFRLAVAKLNTEIIIVEILNASNFEMYLYDKRTPTQIYAHTEPLSSAARYDLTTEAANYYTKLLIRRTMYRYIKNLYYEMPRDDSPPILQSEIPRYIASAASLEVVNREADSNFYLSAGLGAAISRGKEGKFWNSNLISGQIAVRIYDKLYLEGSLNMFAYNAITGSLKYLFYDRNKSFRLMAGIGGSYFLYDRQVLNWDQTNGGLQQNYYIVPSISAMLPISHVYLKAEAQLFIPYRASSRYVFAILPGVLVMF